MAASVLGISPTHVGNLVNAGKLARRRTNIGHRFDIVELLKLRAQRAARVSHQGPRSHGESLLVLADRQRRNNDRANFGM